MRATPAEGSGGVDDDGDLVARARRGDDTAFGVLVEKYQHRLVGLARRLTSNAADAEDVAQEAFLRAYRSLGTFREASSFRTWLFQIAVNTSRTFVSRRSGRPDLASSRWAEPLSDDLASGENVERSFIDRRRVEQALGALPEELRQAVVLRDIEGLDYREIAAVLGVPIGTVESRIFRGRERLRTMLGPASGKETAS